MLGVSVPTCCSSAKEREKGHCGSWPLSRWKVDLVKWEGTEGILEENNHMVTSCSLLKFHGLLHQMLSPTPAFVLRLFPS